LSNVGSGMWKIAHRGASGHAPENTMAAFRLAVEMGAQFIETDLQLTRDAKIIAMHDATVDRTTNGRGKVVKMSLTELRGLDAGAKYLSPEGRSFADERVPTLDEMLQFAKEADVAFFFELKPSQMWGMEYTLVGALRKSDELKRAVVISFDPSVLVTVRRAESTVITGFLAEKPSLATVEKAAAIGARQFLPRADVVTPELIAAVHREGLHIVTWTVNEIEEMHRLIEAGVDGIITDYPDRLKVVLGE
jgi:glycerophosphoryl diester phosphodiesterase